MIAVMLCVVFFLVGGVSTYFFMQKKCRAIESDCLEQLRIINERKEQEGRARFELLYHAAPCAMFAVDEDFCITEWNTKAAELTGYHKDEIVGKKYTVLLDYNREDALVSFINRESDYLMSEKKASIRKKDGSVISVLEGFNYLLDDDSRVVGVIGSFIDITEHVIAEKKLVEAKEELENQTWCLKKTNDLIKILYSELEANNRELKKLDELKSEFVSTVSHELRTPLTIIKEGVTQVLDGVLGSISDEQKDFLSVALENITRLTRIINNLLDISKIESGLEILVRQHFDVVGLVKQLLASFTTSAGEKNIEFKTHFSSDEIIVDADPDKICQVFTNLIGNSLRFTEDGYIRVAINEVEQALVCSVTDTGIGIHKDNIPKLFNKFEQFGRVPGPGDKGTGLGLSIVKGIVELHGGNVWATSTCGSGTKIIFTIPKKIDKKDEDGKNNSSC